MPPELMVFDAGCVAMLGGAQTEIVAALLLTLAVPLHVLVTRTQ